MKPYASYKPSGVPWLGDVPSEWVVEKLKFFAKFVGGGTPSKDEPAYWNGEIPWVSPKDMKRPLIRETEDFITSEGLRNSPCALIPPRSVLTVVRSGILQHTIPVAINTVPVTLNQDMRALIPDDRVESRYLAYQIEGCQKALREEWVKQGATVESIEHQRMVDSRLAVPALDEQQAIADYLDAETARIDTLIHEKDELIGLLQKWRQSVVAEAVTKGLDKTANFQLHPDPWIGIHPSHWIPKKLKYLGVFRAGAGFPVGLQGQTGNPLPFFKVKDIDGANENGIIRESDSTVTPEIALSLGAKVFPPDAIVFAKVGAALLLNRFRLLGKDSCIDNNMMGFMLHHEIANPRFMFWAMQRINFSEIVNPGTVPSLNEPLISNLSIAVPLPDEQQAIADYLDAETAKIDDLIAHTNDEITLLKELRAATIADAVLGRVDVRLKN